MTTYDIAVVGGGIVGAATALRLVRQGRRSVILLEAEDGLARHQSGNNSGVIHSGLYYKPGSLKAQTATAGRDALYRFCEEEGIEHRRCGKLVVATRPEELPALDELERRGRANGLQGLERLTLDEMRRHEPEVGGIAGLWVEETGIVDFAAVTRAYGRCFQEEGGEICLQAAVRAVRLTASSIEIDTPTGGVSARFLINCAGAQSDRLARLCDVDPEVRIVPFRGEYLELVPEARHRVRGLIYPVPDPRLPFLGVHWTRTIDGRVDAGPNAVLALHRLGYERLSLNLRDTAATLTYPGFWRLAARFWRTGVGETWRSLVRRAFAADARRLLPTLKDEELTDGGSGVRAQAVDRQGKLVDDFLIRRGERSLHVVNAPSPAATASWAIGGRVVREVCGEMGS